VLYAAQGAAIALLMTFPQGPPDPGPSYPPPNANDRYSYQQDRTPPGYPPPAYPYAAPPVKNSGAAIASMVLGILGFVFPLGIAGIAYGIIALNQMRHVPQRGRGLAIAGIVCAAAWLVVLFVVFGWDAIPSQ
jgi:hypothetical protein